MGEPRRARSKRKPASPAPRSETRRPTSDVPATGPSARSAAVPRLALVRSEAEPIRWNKVMTAQARIAVGYYDRPDVLESLAEAVLTELDEH